MQNKEKCTPSTPDSINDHLAKITVDYEIIAQNKKGAE
jgi:hypothetical protein